MKKRPARNAIVRLPGAKEAAPAGPPGTTDDAAFVRYLAHAGSAAQPEHTAPARGALLNAVADAHERRHAHAQPSIIARLLTPRALAAVAAAGIFAGGAVRVGASGGVSAVAGNVSDVLQTLHITARTPDQADSHIEDAGSNASADATPGAGKDNGPSNAVQHANENAGHGLQNASEGSDNAGQGIQNANPNGLDHANDNATDGPNADHTPGAVPTQAADHAHQPPALPTQASGNGFGNAPTALPTQANDNASGPGGNGGSTQPNDDAPGSGAGSGQLPDQAGSNPSDQGGSSAAH